MRNMADVDRTSLAAVETWISDPRFRQVGDDLQTMHDRLAAYVNQAHAAGQSTAPNVIESQPVDQSSGGGADNDETAE